MVIVYEARPRLEAEAKERMAAGGRKAAPGRPAEKGMANSPYLSPPVPTTRKQLADLVGVSEHKIRQAEKVREADPALSEQVRAGAVPLRQAVKEVERREETALKATLDRVDPDGAVRQRQAELLAAWAKAHARLSHLVADLMSFDVEEVVSLFDEVQRTGAQVGIDQLRNYCRRLEEALTRTTTLHVVQGEKGR